MGDLRETWAVSKKELLELDSLTLQRLLIEVGDEMLTKGLRMAELEPEYRECKATLMVLREVKSVLQSTLRSVRDLV